MPRSVLLGRPRDILDRILHYKRQVYGFPVWGVEGAVAWFQAYERLTMGTVEFKDVGST